MIPLSSIYVNGTTINLSSGPPVVSTPAVSTAIPTSTSSTVQSTSTTATTVTTTDQATVTGTPGGQYAAIDTGTSLIGGPSNVVGQIYASIKGALRGTGDMTGYYAIR